MYLYTCTKDTQVISCTDILKLLIPKIDMVNIPIYEVIILIAIFGRFWPFSVIILTSKRLPVNTIDRHVEYFAATDVGVHIRN